MNLEDMATIMTLPIMSIILSLAMVVAGLSIALARTKAARKMAQLEKRIQHIQRAIAQITQKDA